MPRGIRAERPESREATGRGARVPLGVSRTKLSVPKRAGYKRRWVNDAEGRLLQAEQGGYQFVLDQTLQIGDADIDNTNRDLGSRVSRVVDKTTGQKSYLMEIPEDLHAEDQAAKAAQVAAIDDRIKKGKVDDAEDRYIPDQGRGIQVETR